MTGRVDWGALLAQGVRVRARNTQGFTHAEGTLIGYCGAPQVLIQVGKSEKVWWRADLTDVLPAKPKEPAGLGAVVEDAKGFLFVRNHASSDECGATHPWHVIDPSAAFPTTWFQYAEIDVARVLSEGVQP